MKSNPHRESAAARLVRWFDHTILIVVGVAMLPTIVQYGLPLVV